MRIKSQKKSVRKSLWGSGFKGKKVLTILLVLMAFGVTLMYGMYKGIQYGKLNKTGDLKGLVSNIKKTNVGVVENYFSSLMLSPPSLSLDIAHNDYQKLAFFREKSIKNGQIVPEAKEETVKAVVKHDGKAYDAKVRLIGQNLDHVSDHDKWSLKLAIKGSHTLFGMKKMSLVNPFARGGADAHPIHEWLCHKLSAKEQLIHLRYKFVDVSINGKEVGIYALEENFNKRLIENNKEREGIIFKPTQDGGIDIYGEAFIKSTPKFAQQLNLLTSLWEGFQNGELATKDLFDLEKMASYYAIADLVNGHHTHWLGNTQYYFNPISRLIEPIGREWEAPYHERASMFLHHPIYDDTYHKKLFADADFVAAYTSKLETMCSTAYLDEFLAEINDELELNVGILHKDYPFYNFSPAFLYDNQKALLYELNKKMVDANAYLDRSDATEWRILIDKKTDLPIDVQALVVNDTIQIKDFQWGDNEIIVKRALFPETIHEGSIALQYVLPGSSNIQLDVVQLYNKEQMKQEYRFPAKNYIESHPGVVIDHEKKTYSFQPGKWEVAQRLIVPRDYELHCAPGTSLDFVRKGGILSYGTVFFEGTEAAPIAVMSSDSTGQGFHLIKAKQKSLFKHVTFQHQSAMKEYGWAMTGSVCAYESEVAFYHCVFADNFAGDDYVNLFKSDFVLEDCDFINTKSDAFDSDFCSGIIKDCRFINSGNDAIDCSGSVVEITNVLMDIVADKGLSAGEKSKFFATNVVIKNAELAVACKDLSFIEGTNIQVDDCKVAYTAFQKKPEYGAASIRVTESHINQVELISLLEKRSEIVLDGVAYEADNELVKKRLYGAEFGKSSR